MWRHKRCQPAHRLPRPFKAKREGRAPRERRAADSLSPPPSGHPRGWPRHELPRATGERGVRGSNRACPLNAGRAIGASRACKSEAPRGEVSSGAAPHPNPLPASGERGSGRCLPSAACFVSDLTGSGTVADGGRRSARRLSGLELTKDIGRVRPGVRPAGSDPFPSALCGVTAERRRLSRTGQCRGIAE